MATFGHARPGTGPARRWRGVVLAVVLATTSLVWATGTAQSARADLSQATALCVESVGAVNHVQDTVFGPDGNLWWVEATPPAVGRMNITTGRISRFSNGLLIDRDLLKSITVGPDGNLWITSNQFNRVGRVTTAGVITMFSNGITPGTPPYGSVPNGITAGPDGNVWFTELNNKVIGRVTPAGVITEFPFTGDRPGGASQITLGADNHLWFATPGFIGRMSPTTGAVQKFVTGVEPLFDAGGDAVRGSPFAITATPDGNIWFTRGPSQNGVTVSRLTPQGQVTDYAIPPVGADFPVVTGSDGFLTDLVLGPDGALWVTDLFGGRILRVSTSGQVTEFGEGLRLDYGGQLFGVGPEGITVGPDGALWYGEFLNNGFTGVPGGIGRITTSGVVSSFGNTSDQSNVPDGAPASLPFFDAAAGPDGNMWFTNGFGLVRVTPDGRMRQFVDGFSTGPVPGGLLRALTSGVAAGPDGNIWFTEAPYAGSPAIGRMTPAGVVTEFTAGLSAGSVPGYIVAGPDGNLWFTDSGNNRIGRMTPTGGITEFSAGITGIPAAITAGPDGNVWFTEIGGRIGRITRTGVVTEFAVPTEGVMAAITLGPDGNLWFTEEFTSVGTGRIGRITPTGTVTMFSDGLQTHAILPTAVRDIVAADGVLWFTSRTTNQLGRITTDGHVTMFSAKGSNLGTLDFSPYPDFPLGAPLAIAADPSGNLWWSDFNGSFIKFGHATERDNIGDPCTPDEDGDGIRDVIDNCPFVVNANQRDGDNDGIGDLCDRSVTIEVGPTGFGRDPSARLLDATGQPMVGKTIVFTTRDGGRTCSAVTNLQGRAVCSFGRAYSWGDYKATYAGDATHDPGSGQTWHTR